VERTPTPDASVTASAQPAIRYYEHKDGEIDSQTPYTDKGLAASWKSALSVNVGSGKRRIAIERTDIAHAVRASDYAANDQSGSIFVDAHTKWKETRADRLMANRTGLSAGKLAVQASCVAPARPVLDIGTPCEVTAFTDDMPTIVTTEKIDVYPRPEVDYSVMQDGVFVVTESAHYAGYESEGGPTPDKECAKICPGEPISCEPIATGYCAERDTFTETFWPSALAASETILGNAAKLARDAIALERLFDPTNANPTYIKSQIRSRYPISVWLLTCSDGSMISAALSKPAPAAISIRCSSPSSCCAAPFSIIRSGSERVSVKRHAKLWPHSAQKTA